MTEENPFALEPERKPVTYRSISQVKQYLPEMGGCPYSYYLARRLRAWDRPAAWLPMGTAVHKGVEEYEKSGRTMDLEQAQLLYRQSYVDSVNKMLSTTPNLDFWFSSGPYLGEADIERRFSIGEGQVEKYLNWAEQGKGRDQPIW